MIELIDKRKILNKIEEMANTPSIQKNADTCNGLIGAHKIVYEEKSVKAIPVADIKKWVKKREKQYRKDYIDRWHDCPYKMNAEEHLMDILNSFEDMIRDLSKRSEEEC